MKKSTNSSLFLLIGFLFITQPVTEAFSASPYPPSPIISDITWDQSTILRRGQGSDIWIPTWASDGHLYSSWGDGDGFAPGSCPYKSSCYSSLGVARIVGPPENFIGTNVWGEPGYAENVATFDGKAGGILSVDGILYMFRGPGSEWDAIATTYLAWSNDLGASWQSGSEVFFRATNDGFAPPIMLNFGQDYEGARDNFVYLYSTDLSAGGGTGPFVDVVMARVHKDKIKDRSSYEFFKGLDGNGNPLWAKDVSLSQPIWSDPNGGYASSVTYNAGINRYLMVVTNGGSRSTLHGGIGIFDAPEPWGPWTTAYYDPSFLGSTTLFGGHIPTKWISSDGKSFYLVYSGYGSVAQDAYQHIKGQLILIDSDDGLPPDSPKNLQITP